MSVRFRICRGSFKTVQGPKQVSKERRVLGVRFNDTEKETARILFDGYSVFKSYPLE